MQSFRITKFVLSQKLGKKNLNGETILFLIQVLLKLAPRYTYKFCFKATNLKDGCLNGWEVAHDFCKATMVQRQISEEREQY